MRCGTSGDDEAARQHAQRLVKSRPGLHCRSRKDHDGGVHYLSGHFVARRATRTPVLGAREAALQRTRLPRCLSCLILLLLLGSGWQ